MPDQLLDPVFRRGLLLLFLTTFSVYQARNKIDHLCSRQFLVSCRH